MAKAFVLATLALMVLLPLVPPAVATPTTHNGCMLYGWWGLPSALPVPSLPVPIPFMKSSPASGSPDAGLVCSGYPNSYPNPNPHWASWSRPCTGVPPGTALDGVWCGGAVAASGNIDCTLHGVGAIVVGVDRNGDGYVNELDAGGRSPWVSEVFGAGYPGAPGYGLGRSPGWPAGGRIIAFSVMGTTWGATATSTIEASCL